MAYTRTPPKHDCFRDLLVKLDPQVLENALRSWVADDLQLSLDDEPLPVVSLDGQTTTETAYSITSLSRQQANAEQLAKIIRDHWGRIENGVHWVRDVVFDEDRCTIHRGHSPQNWATARNAALNFLRTLKIDNLAATIGSYTRNSLRLFALLGYVK